MGDNDNKHNGGVSYSACSVYILTVRKYITGKDTIDLIAYSIRKGDDNQCTLFYDEFNLFSEMYLYQVLLYLINIR